MAENSQKGARAMSTELRKAAEELGALFCRKFCINGPTPLHANECKALRAELQRPEPVTDAGREELEWACKFYCDWYEGKTGKGMDGGSVAYEIVSAIRKVLANRTAPEDAAGRELAETVRKHHYRMHHTDAGTFDRCREEMCIDAREVLGSKGDSK